jgi:hypothetical protein
MNFGEYLQEEEFLLNILPPEFDQSINTETLNGIVTIDFSNDGRFKGTIENDKENGKKKKGIYTWHNGQKYSGNFFNDFFHGKGFLEFPNNFTLHGNFSGDRHSYLIKAAIYTTNDKIYQGSFKNNLRHGKFVINNKEGYPFYKFIGSYYNGIKDDNFILEKEVDNERIEIIGKFKRGLKNGHFFFKKFNSEHSIIEQKDLYFEDDYILNYYENNQKIEAKNAISNEVGREIYCMAIFKINNRNFLLLGSEFYLLIYNINENENYSITYNKKILMLIKGRINDILIFKNGNKLLLCSNTNRFKLIELKPILVAQSGRVIIRHNLIQEFQGRENGNSIYMLLELSNELVISGDSQNLIIWEKNYIEANNNENKENNEIVNNETEMMEIQPMNIFQKILKVAKNYYLKNCPNCLGYNDDNQTDIDFVPIEEENYDNNDINYNKNFNYQQKFHIDRDIDGFDLSHIFSVLEINRKDNTIVIAVTQSDSQNLYFFEIYDDDYHHYNQIKKIENINSIRNCKKIMLCVDNDILLVGCYNRVAIVQILNNYELIKFVNFNSITNFSNYIGNSFICATMKREEGLYNYQCFLTQGELVRTENGENVKISIISSQNNNYHQGNIIDTSIIDVNNNRINFIITIGTDGKIISLL